MICILQGGFGSGNGGSKKSSASKLVSYNQDGTVILRAPERMYLSSTNFSLHMAPVLSVDSGEYFCLVNDQRHPSLVTRILVQGREMIFRDCIRVAELKLSSIHCACPESGRGGRRGKLRAHELESFISLPFLLSLRFCRILPHFSPFAPRSSCLSIFSRSLSRCCMHFCIVSPSTSGAAGAFGHRARHFCLFDFFPHL